MHFYLPYKIIEIKARVKIFAWVIEVKRTGSKGRTAFMELIYFASCLVALGTKCPYWLSQLACLNLFFAVSKEQINPKAPCGGTCSFTKQSVLFRQREK